MHRRRFCTTLAATTGLSLAGCLGDDDDEDDELVGKGTLRLQNRSGGSIVLEYGLLEEDTAIDNANLVRQQLTLDGDEAEIVFTERTGGPYRMVVVAPERDWEPVEEPWVLEECQELTLGVTAHSDGLNLSLYSCVAGPASPGKGSSE